MCDGAFISTTANSPARTKPAMEASAPIPIPNATSVADHVPAPAPAPEHVEQYTRSIEWASDEATTKAEIFKAARAACIDELLGLLDGIVLRTKDSLVKGFVKQFSDRILDEDLMLSLEHAALHDRPDHVKAIAACLSSASAFILMSKSLERVKEKRPSMAAHIERQLKASR